MDKKLDREFGRFDVDLLDSAEYLSMPVAIRNHAYLYLLALTGWSRKHRTDGLVARKVARQFAERMGCELKQLVRALLNVSLISVQNGDVFLTKYDKWQETKAEIEARKQANRDRQARHRNALVTRDVTGESRVSHATEQERERERFNASPNPQGGTGAGKDDPALELGVAMHELLGRQISTVDLIACQAAVNQYAYLTVKDLVVRAHDHVDYCRDHTLPTPRTVDGFSDTWRRENDYRADKGLPKAERVSGGRVTGMTKAFEMAS
jgi:hypothetical protein